MLLKTGSSTEIVGNFTVKVPQPPAQKLPERGRPLRYLAVAPGPALK
jgi:hypothetical protein